MVFSDPVTHDEIDAARKEYESKKDLEGLDANNIIDSKRKRVDDNEYESLTHKKSKSSETVVKVEKQLSTSSKDERKKKYEDQDEEATF